MPVKFNCTGCGLCCNRRTMLDGDLPDDWFGEGGWCKNLQPDMSCGIYEKRPLVCRVDDAWDDNPVYVKDRANVATREEFHELLYKGCKKLQDEADGV